jgi:hypothetical protein
MAVQKRGQALQQRIGATIKGSYEIRFPGMLKMVASTG